MYCNHNNLLPPLFFDLFFTSSQIDGYSTRRASNIIMCIFAGLILKKFTILMQGPKIWNFLPVTNTSLSGFSKIIAELAKPHTVALLCKRVVTYKVA